MPRTILLILMLFGFAMIVNAQTDEQPQIENKEIKKNFLYQWTDKKGVVHIADGLDKVPKDYRDKAIKLRQPTKEDVDQEKQVQQQTVSPSGIDEEHEADLKEEWQHRMKNARLRLADAEKHQQELGERKNELLQRPGGAASGKLVDPAEMDRVELELKDAQREVDAARNDVDVVIPDAARKAGIPPGWLRE